MPSEKQNSAGQGAPHVGFGSRQTRAGTLAESLTGLASESLSTLRWLAPCSGSQVACNQLALPG